MFAKRLIEIKFHFEIISQQIDTIEKKFNHQKRFKIQAYKMKKFFGAVLSLGAAISLSGCASIVSGSHQDISINTSPEGAKCAVYRDGVQVGYVNSTPGIVSVSRRSSDIWVGCVKDNYDFSNAKNSSDFNGWVIGNLGFGGLIGLVVDMSTGASHAYDRDVNMTLPTLPAGVGAPVGLPDHYPSTIVRQSVAPLQDAQQASSVASQANK